MKIQKMARSFMLSSVLILACGQWAQANVSKETEEASRALGANMVSEITFDAESAALTDSAKQEIRDFIASARGSGNIDEIKLAVWADREYPATDTKASKADINLARERAKNVKNFMREELSLKNVDTYNMTERPNALQKFLHTPTAKMKSKMETAGAAPQTTDDIGWFGQKAQASKAVVMVYIK